MSGRPWYSRFRRVTVPTVLVAVGVFAGLAGSELPGKLEPDGAPDRQTDGPGVPRPIVWPAPPLGSGPFTFETAEERHVRADVVVRGLVQPWSLAFLPDGDILITERPGRLRI